MKPSQSSTDKNEVDDDLNDSKMLISQLPKSRFWLKGVSKYQGFWFPTFILHNIFNFQKNFKANDEDIILVSKPKSGTTWLKALLFSIVNRTRFTSSNTPLLTSNPHKLVPFFEFTLYSDGKVPDLTDMTRPRLFSTHIPYSSLSDSIKTSKCRIVYVSRNPLDAIVSFAHFTAQDHPGSGPEEWTMEDTVDSFCLGRDAYGPFWDHILEFWRESLERPDKVLFLKYEDMKEDIELQVKKIAEFVGFPFSGEEEKRGVVREICELCSFRSLKELEAKNNHEDGVLNFKNSYFYRKGEVGGWVDELSPSMVERVEKVIQEKMGGSNLTFEKSL